MVGDLSGKKPTFLMELNDVDNLVLADPPNPNQSPCSKNGPLSRSLLSSPSLSSPNVEFRDERLD